MEEIIEINGVKYCLCGCQKADELDGMDYVIVRTYSAGVFAGYLKWRKGKEALILKARRIWKWHGAASLSELAMKGSSKPEKCKFPQEVIQVELTEVIEVLQCTKEAQESIQNVKIWSEH